MQKIYTTAKALFQPSGNRTKLAANKKQHNTGYENKDAPYSFDDGTELLDFKFILIHNTTSHTNGFAESRAFHLSNYKSYAAMKQNM